MSDPRHALEQITSLITRHLGANLRGLYLFGSLPAGAFRPGKSDIDWWPCSERMFKTARNLRR